jgi:predicted RNase H-like HicB family nuclease
MSVVVFQRSGGWEALSLDLPGCRGRGATPEEATRGLARAGERMAEAYARAGRLFPQSPSGEEEPLPA